MKILCLTFVLGLHLYLADAALNKTYVPYCGSAFLFTKDDPEYYENHVAEAYEQVADKSGKVVFQKVRAAMAPDRKQLGRSVGYFDHCNEVEGTLSTKKGLEKYAHCRLPLTPAQTEAASYAMAKDIPDTTKGLADAAKALNDKFKGASQVKTFEKCLKTYKG
ncbi:unnamed protein product [Acanthoscelides obtectus]|uniref:Uncharacterized protein n=1 Tax=Acanthoscelides obtectus TaxID=200917 RepID=A0A9P0LUS3_ACAOB|nr:unnamed protein product [Acanthoscelides obtectus]CAK1651309.1 hypothetical protein AOBTE_LOCUS17171 [Acanthoscelides obtectus]